MIVGDFNLPELSWVNEQLDYALEPINVSGKNEDLIDSFSFPELFQYNSVANSKGRILDLVLPNCVEMGEVVRCNNS